MAELPQFRTLPQLVGSMSQNFLSKLDDDNIVPGLDDLKPGSPFLAIFESVGQSQARVQQQMLMTLDARNIDDEEGDELDKRGVGLKCPRRGATFSRGSVTIGDSSFARVVSKLYVGAPAPIPGTSLISVADGSQFPATGAIYIGRGTSNLEGPLTYSSVQQQGQFWAVQLTAGTQRYHALTEAVTLAQGGDRVVQAGQVVLTSQSGTSSAVSFATSQTVVVPDGEVEVDDVPVVCQQSGTSGNVAQGAIKETQAPAFQGMTVTNPLPIQNGLAIEDDDHYRERLKQADAARYGGAPTAIVQNAYGISSADESSTITSAALVLSKLKPNQLVIDDGSGYEAKEQGINFEVLIDSAIGGEDTFHLVHGRPVAKASQTTLLQAPFSLVEGVVLAVRVGGVHAEHSFEASDFRAITNATAYEVAASINKNPDLPFCARTTDGGQKVALLARAEEGDDIEVVQPLTGQDANQYLDFPAGVARTLWLYLNDRLLAKDGSVPTLSSTTQAVWRPMSGAGAGEALIIDVDGTGFRTYALTDADFANTGLGYATLSNTNSLTAWQVVLTKKLTGVTVVVNGSFLELTSNLGSNAGASLTIDPTSSLVQKGMFDPTALAARGQARDFVLDRNIGQVELVEPLKAGDRLTGGTPFTRAHLDSTSSAQVTISAAPANLWVAADGGTAIVPTGLNASHILHVTYSATSPMRRIEARLADNSVAVAVFGNLLVGDLFVLASDDIGQGTGAWRIANIDPGLTWFEVERDPQGASGSLLSPSTTPNYVTFVRGTAQLQHIVVTNGAGQQSYWPADLVATLNSQLRGCFASLNDSGCLRITTSSYALGGGLAIVGQDANARLLGLPLMAVANNQSLTGFVESLGSELGTPNFLIDSPDTLTGTTGLTGCTCLTGYGQGLIDQLLWLRSLPTVNFPARYGALATEHVPTASITDASTFTLQQLDHRPITTSTGLDGPARAMGVSSFRFGPESYLNVTLDGDLLGKSFSVPLFRRMVVDQSVPYGQTIRLLDADLAATPAALGGCFGQGFDFSNFALHARARCIVDQGSATKAILWRRRHYRGDLGSTVTYQAPGAANATLTLTVDDATGNITIGLPSDASNAVVITAAQLVTQVNALGRVIEGALIGDGSGVITTASTATMADGLLLVQRSAWNTGAQNYDLTLKWAPSAALATVPNDWLHETFRLVPTTAKNVADLLNLPAVTGLSLGGGSFGVSSDGNRLQVATQQLGSAGSVLVTGGSASELRLQLAQASVLVGSVLKAPVRMSADLSTVPTMAWAFVDNAAVSQKRMNWTSAHTVQFQATNSRVRVSGGATAWTATHTPISANRWLVEQHGRLVGYTAVGTTLAGVSSGDWVTVEGGVGSTASPTNLGTFRVVYATGSTFWVENDIATPEDATIGKVSFFTYDSVMPGDTLQVGTTAFGAVNQGLFTVTAIDPNDTGAFFVAQQLVDNTSVMGQNVAYLGVVGARPARTFCRVLRVLEDPNDATVANLYLDSLNTNRPELVSVGVGSVITLLDRLDLPEATVGGQDGYRHNTGLIAEANRVLYGDEADTDTYPGVIGAGADIFIGPPLIRRQKVSVAVREVSGSNTTPRVQAAIAQVINQGGAEPVAISEYLKAAGLVDGVLSVVPLDPVPTPGQDTLPVQAGERAKVLDLDMDVQVSIIGQ